MSILSGVINSIRDLLGIEKTTPQVTSAQNSDKNTPVIQCENVGKNEDVYIPEKSDSSKNESSKVGGVLSLGAFKNIVENLAVKSGFAPKAFKVGGLLEKVAGITEEEFQNLSSEDKKQLTGAIEYAMNKYAELSKQGAINKDANTEKLTLGFCSLVYEALTSGVFKDAEEYDNAVGDVYQELGEDFDKLSVEEQRTVLRAKRVSDDKALAQELEAVEEMPEEEQNAAADKIRRRHRLVQKGRFMRIASHSKSETAMNAMVILKSDDISWGAQSVLETRCSYAERTETADYAKYEFTKGLIKDFKSFGDEVKPESLKGYNTVVVSYKSEKATVQYQENYVKNRNIYERAIAKQARGETLSAEEQEILAIMSIEQYTAIAQGIGEGALNNVNMTASQKAEFISKWDNDARKYSDYAVVTQNVKDLLKTSEYKEIAEKIEKIKTEEIKKAKEAKTAVEKKTKTETRNISNNSTTSNTASVLEQKDETIVTSPSKAEKSTTNPIVQSKPKITNPVIVAHNIEQNGVEKSIKEFGKTDVITTILNDKSLKYLRPQLATIIKTYDKKALIEITQNCSDSAFIWVCSIINPDYIEDLKANRANLCWYANKQLENMEKEYEAA